MHMAQTLLSDLCSICHSETPKYRCPRCKTQTCSLPCYKRHQQRAACSGKRDPAAYVKKNDLATPTGVDRDYNYLKTVERTIEDADKLTAERGIGVEASNWKRAASSRQPNSRLDKYLERNSITIERAPAGMSRQKTNRTRMTNAGNVHWTVEWVDGDGERRIKDDCIESASIGDLYGLVHAEKLKAERRQLEESRFGQTKKRGLKRKREQNQTESQRKLDDVSAQNEAAFVQDLTSAHVSTTAGEVSPTPEGTGNTGIKAANESIIDDVNQNEGHEAASAASSPAHTSTEPSESQATTMETKPRAAPNVISAAEAPSNPAQHFYLLKPGTASPTCVLIPLKPEETLTEALRSHTVQEYPTIYVLPDAPAALGPGFMLEADYLNKMASKSRHGRASSATAGHAEALSGSRDSPGGKQGEERDDNSQLDAKSILKMLKRDVAL